MLIRSGSRGANVVKLQKELKAAGCNPGSIDGVFGQHTLSAVKAYQRKHHLSVDGVVGPKTWNALTHDRFSPGHKPSARHPATQQPPAHHPTVKPPSGTHGAKVNKMLAEARKHLGFHEGPATGTPSATTSTGRTRRGARTSSATARRRPACA